MTAEPDLLPLPEWYEPCGPTVKRDLRTYARANVAHHVAAKDAEIEALKVEVAAQRTRADAMAGEAIKYEARAKRLAEALRTLLPYVATQAVGCHGDKCREDWCYSCFGEEEAEEAAARGLAAFRSAHALLRDSEAASA